MAKQIDKLTESQIAAMPRYVEKWIDIGTATDRINYDEALDIVNAVQTELLNSKKTPVVIFDNPLECWVAANYAHYHNVRANDLHAKVDEFFNGNKITLEPFVMPHLTGSFDASVFSFYDFFRNEVGLDYGDYTHKYNIWESTTKLGLIFPLEKVAIVSQKPTVVKLNDETPRRTHCDGGPAISYAGRGDFNIYILNGVRVPKWLAVNHSASIELERYNELTNADVKMEFVRKVGVERMISMGKKIDSYEKYNDEWWDKSEYELYDMAKIFIGVPYAPHLKMLNQTTKVWHVEAVSPTCRNLAQAIEERLGGKMTIKGIA